MKVLTSVLTVVVLPLLVVANGDDHQAGRRHYARQVSSSASTPSSSSSATSSISGSVTSGSTASNTSSLVTPTISPLLSTNPTAVPLASITANQSSPATVPQSTTETPGATPTYFSGPPIPNTVSLVPTHYPTLDKVPPTDTPEVLQWIAEVNATGIVIPDFAPNNPGGCPNNTHVNPSINGTCWWTCGGCTAPFDVTECPSPLTWGLTYDDGPGFYTTELLDYLEDHGLKTTFFNVGSRCLQFPAILQLEYIAGHQTAVHTWSHPYLTTLTNEQIIAELGWTKKIMKDVLGVTPSYMRPPFGDIDGRVRAICIAMGLTPVMWTRISPTATFDTGDFYIASNTTTSYQVIQNWEYILDNVTDLSTGFIVLEHDLFLQTVELATGYILPDALAFRPAFTIEPVISCLGLPFSDAYIETNNNKSHPPLISGSFVTIVHPSATGSAGEGGKPGKSAAPPRLSVGFSVMFLTTVVSLLASVCAVRF